METESTAESGNETVESINAQIDQVRSERKPFQGSRKADNRMNDLYKQKAELEGTAGDMIPGSGSSKTLTEDIDGNIGEHKGRDRVSNHGEDDMGTDALAAAKEAGLDVSNLNPDDMTEATVEGLKHLSLIKTGDLKTLAPLLSKAANDLEMPRQTVFFLEQFVTKIAQPGDPLSDAILETISNYIYDARS